MSEALTARYAKQVPRYTSYPTAPHFHAGVDSTAYAAWLKTLPDDSALSLYVHVPFCDRLCWFCGCHTKQVLRYDPIAAYLPVLVKEMETVAGLLDGRGRAVALHLGGGSPSMLQPDDMVRIGTVARELFGATDALEFSIEIDPNDMTADRYDAFARAGVTRISVGVQDFDPKVQAAINRPQTYEQTRAVVDGMRERGVGSVNLDVLYGLPYQTVATVETTINLVLSMLPDRIALFGYAHVPWMKTHQKMIEEATLPDLDARFAQSQAAAAKLLAAGYETIGIDHFALPTDSLAAAARSGELRRNFQGYTTDAAPVLLGFGASAIGALPQGHLQNVTATGEYMRHVNETGLAVARGIALNSEDRMRGWVIERLMCDFSVSARELMQRFGDAAQPLLAELQEVAADDDNVRIEDDAFVVSAAGRPFVRSIAARFDSYFGTGAARHSASV